MSKAIVKSVDSLSIAEEASIEPGDEILTVNDIEFNDILEFNYLISSNQYSVKVKKKDGNIEVIDVETEGYEDFGVNFETSLIDKPKSCKNKCIFCFIDQLPKGLRSSLYFKDDDYRLSFLLGNYVTLSNMSKDEIDRIIRYRISPINISVHTTNPDLRIKMLNNNNAGKIKDYLNKFSNNNIIMNTQIVLCKGINDGNELDKSLKDLTSLYPNMHSVSVVPVGLTKYRENLYTIEGYNSHEACDIINQVEKWQKQLLDTYGSRIVYAADELYIKAGKDMPDYNSYEDFPQIENGVGMISSLKEEFYSYLSSLEFDNLPDSNISIATGKASFKIIKELCNNFMDNYDNININVFEIENTFFGDNVTVTGLLTGKDIINQLKGKSLGERLLLSSSVLRNERDLLLDNTSIKDIENSLNIKVVIVDNNGYDLIDKIIG